jgi:hypothetical protein
MKKQMLYGLALLMLTAACSSDKSTAPEERTDTPIMNETGDEGATEMKKEAGDTASKTMDSQNYYEETKKH